MILFAIAICQIPKLHPSTLYQRILHYHFILSSCYICSVLIALAFWS
jgi:hypothetical protein